MHQPFCDFCFLIFRSSAELKRVTEDDDDDDDDDDYADVLSD